MKMFRKTFALLLVLALALCLAPAVFAVEDGTEQNPYVVIDENSVFGTDVELQSVDAAYQNATYFSMTAVGSGVAVITVNYVAPVADPYGDIADVEAVSIGCLNKTTDTYAYTDIMLWQGATSGTIYVPINSGDELLFDFLVGLPMEYEDCLLGLNISLAGSRENPIYVDGNPTKLSASSEMVVYYTGDWMPFSGASIYQEYSMQNRNPSVADLTAYIAGETWTDEDGDGKIEVTLSEDPTSYTTTIGLIHEGQGIKQYTVALTAEGQFECAHENTTSVGKQDAGECHANGHEAHQICDDCGAIISEDGTTELTADDINIPAANHDCITLIPGQEALCEADGVMDSYYCTECGGRYYDDNGTEPVEDLNDLHIDATGHVDMHEYPEMAATCGQPGSTGYWMCWGTGCYKYFRDEAATEEITEEDAVIPQDPDNHSWVEEEVIQEHSCEQDGIIQYKCEYCWDEENDKPIRMTETTPAHTLEHHEATDDCIEYWSCEDCGKLYADAEAKTEITDEADLIPPTGDMNIFVPIAVAMMSLGGILVLAKKKED